MKIKLHHINFDYYHYGTAMWMKFMFNLYNRQTMQITYHNFRTNHLEINWGSHYDDCWYDI